MSRPKTKYDAIHIRNLLDYCSLLLRHGCEMPLLISALRAIKLAKKALDEESTRPGSIGRLHKVGKQITVRIVRQMLFSIAQNFKNARELNKAGYCDLAQVELLQALQAVRRIKASKPFRQKVIRRLTGIDHLALVQYLLTRKKAIRREIKHEARRLLAERGREAKKKKQKHKEDVATLMHSITKNLSCGVHVRTERQLRYIKQSGQKRVLIEILGSEAAADEWLQSKSTELQELKSAHLQTLRARQH